MTQHHLEVVIADTAEARRLHYQLRYQVFCVEMEFEDASKYPDGEEKDEFDDRATHFLVRDVKSDAWLAAARLIPPGDDPLPIVRHCAIARTQLAANQSVRLEATAEVSRLLMMREVRRRSVDLNAIRLSGRPRRVTLKPPAQERRRSPVVFKTIFLAIAAYCREQGIPQAVFFCTAALLRILQRMGIDLTPISDPCQHRGVRFPVVANIDQVYETLSHADELEATGDHRNRHYRLFSELSSTASSAEPVVELPIARGTSL